MKNITHLKTAMLQAVLITATLIGTSSCTGDQNQASAKSLTEESASSTAGVASAEDTKFLVQVTDINLEEIRLGQLAQQKGTMADVKALGKMMEASHTKCQNDLAALAAKKTITLPTSPSANAVSDFNKLNSATGAEFDKEYCTMMVNGHNDAIALFEKEATGAADQDIRQWAEGVLPELHKHLSHAQACQNKTGKM